MTPAEILLTAADALESHDWCQGANFIDAEGKEWKLEFLDEPDADPVAADAVGAICIAAGDDVEARNRALDLVELHLAGGNKDVRPSIATWNDERRRTKAEVVATLRRVARENG